jgi:hypothetical protein
MRRSHERIPERGEEDERQHRGDEDRHTTLDDHARNM